jgi:hypothetical protein
MNLAQGDERRGWVAGDCFGQKLAVAGYDLPVVGVGKAEIQFAGSVFSAVGTAEAAAASAETVPKPAEFFPFWDWQPLDAIGSYMGGGGGWTQLLRGSAIEAHAAGYSGRFTA